MLVSLIKKSNLNMMTRQFANMSKKRVVSIKRKCNKICEYDKKRIDQFSIKVFGVLYGLSVVCVLIENFTD